ncbi:formate dehydrogenase accessory sulfurtransferase FdhD [Hydrogenophaga sp. PBL-H3]|uniref:formate dehydrogenase accessory sulfurtransferase FdhD n=1 Tax=Hydrogenophaga sp. PBL-H3 TaxID=434010 RepID=UPI00131FA7B2|nr:formate dehydrogenase accessory sulfurtransferase FdhD [Hydrogenophaga sp. PBL-H3]QHE77459.1 formate dehydrogenase accessory sulfurtransferase FdhD [Hydrogenophaga sp. PBL-H3]QHE81883.1 formate dehydrogenase accessory sulfurtransferase FdhD [Hydrogenophaga sp. PBL-H3]
MPLPHLTQARAPLTREVEVMNQHGERESIFIPAERDLTVYVDKRELVTLMTLGAHPEWLVLGYLLNQRLIASSDEIESITVDWEVGAASVKTRHGIDHIEERTSKRVVTTGCGQGSVFGNLMDEIDSIQLPANMVLRQSQLYAIVNAIRLKESTYKSAGSVHACALFLGEELQLFVEDVGRHNAVDTIAGWMALTPTLPTAFGSLPPEGADPAWGGPAPDRSASVKGDKIFYTTGRLTSEMVIKSAQMGVAVVVSRSGITQMGLDVARRVGLCAIGRATNKHFLCYSHPERLVLDALPPAAPAARERAASPT